MTSSNRGKVKTGLTSLAKIFTGKLTATNAVGVADGVLKLGDAGREAMYARRSNSWFPLPIEKRSGPLILSLLDVEEEQGREWYQTSFSGTKVLVRYERTKGFSFWSETNPDGVMSALRLALWKRGDVLTLAKGPAGKPMLAPFSTKITIIDSDPRRLLWAQIEPLLQGMKEHRTVLLHGNLGVGKKTLALALASCAMTLWEEEEVDTGILIVPKLESSAEGTIGPLRDMIDLAKPSVLIFADVDRARSSSAITDMVTKFREDVPLIITTTNIASTSKLPESFKLPGQFDLIRSVMSLGTDFSQKFVGDRLWSVMDETQRALTSKWPVAYLLELKRQMVSGGADLGETIRELQARLA